MSTLVLQRSLIPNQKCFSASILYFGLQYAIGHWSLNERTSDFLWSTMNWYMRSVRVLVPVAAVHWRLSGTTAGARVYRVWVCLHAHTSQKLHPYRQSDGATMSKTIITPSVIVSPLHSSSVQFSECQFVPHALLSRRLYYRLFSLPPPRRQIRNAPIK